MPKLRTLAAGIGADVVDIPEIWESAVPGRSDSFTEPAISKRAYELWVERGCPEGSPEQDWYRAESELKDGAHGRSGDRGVK